MCDRVLRADPGHQSSVNGSRNPFREAFSLLHDESSSQGAEAGGEEALHGIGGNMLQSDVDLRHRRIHVDFSLVVKGISEYVMPHVSVSDFNWMDRFAFMLCI